MNCIYTSEGYKSVAWNIIRSFWFLQNKSPRQTHSVTAHQRELKLIWCSNQDIMTPTGRCWSSVAELMAEAAWNRALIGCSAKSILVFIIFIFIHARTAASRAQRLDGLFHFAKTWKFPKVLIQTFTEISQQLLYWCPWRWVQISHDAPCPNTNYD